MQNLRALRRTRSLTFLDLADLTGIPARQLAEIEYGLRRLSSAEREALAMVLGLAPSDFTGAHRRPTATVARVNALAPSHERALQLLVAVALSATIATSALRALPEPRLTLKLAPASALLAGATTTNTPPFVGATGAAASLAELATATDEAAAITRVVSAILELRAALPEPQLSPALLVAPTPHEHVAPAPLPVIEAAPPFMLTDAGPLGCPVQPSAGRVVLTQGYGVGSHAPAEVWGAVDLAVDGDGDGYAEAGASWYAPIVATHDGHVMATPDSYPGGNYVSVIDPTGVWRTGYGHLAIITVASGQYVRAGEQIGLLGSTGMSSGPHLDYQVWRSGVNLDPTSLVGC